MQRQEIHPHPDAKHRNDGKTLLRIDYADWTDFLSHVTNKPTRSGANDQSTTGTQSFTGTRDYQTALDLARHGWTEGRARMTAALASASTYTVTTTAPTLSLDVAGLRPNVALAAAGAPDCMYHYGDQQNAARPIVRLIVNRTISGGCSTTAIENFGAAVLATIDNLEAAGTRCEIIAAWAGEARKTRLMMQIPVKAAGEPLDIDRAAFALAHPAMFRRLMFRATELDATYDAQHHGTYGIVVDPTPAEINQAYWLPGPTLTNQDDYKTLPAAVRATERAIDAVMRANGAALSYYDLINQQRAA